jgi:hypothetical protein
MPGEQALSRPRGPLRQTVPRSRRSPACGPCTRNRQARDPGLCAWAPQVTPVSNG